MTYLAAATHDPCRFSDRLKFSFIPFAPLFRTRPSPPGKVADSDDVARFDFRTLHPELNYSYVYHHYKYFNGESSRIRSHVTQFREPRGSGDDDGDVGGLPMRRRQRKKKFVFPLEPINFHFRYLE